MVPVTMLPSYLPDVCLSNIFDRVPLRDLLCFVRVVCTNWNQVVPTELRHRRSLVIVRQEDIGKIREYENLFNLYMVHHNIRREDGSPLVRLEPLDQIYFNALLVPGGGLTKTFTTALITTLSSISQLTVVHGDVPRNKRKMLKQLARLVNHYGNDLVCLKLYIDVQYREDLVANFSTLFGSINELDSLRHLTLNVNWPNPNLELNLPVLSHLDTFTSNIGSSSLVNTYRQYATGNVRIVDCQLNLSLKKMLRRLDPQLASKFTRAELSTFLRVGDFNRMRLFSDRFTSITRLSLCIDTMPMTMLARCLSPLTQLVLLHIQLPCPIEEVPEVAFVQVPSVRVLVLRTDLHSHDDIEKLYLAELFPNLQVVQFIQKHFTCDECKYLFAELDEQDRARQCLRLARESFVSCANDVWTVTLPRTFQLVPQNDLSIFLACYCIIISN